MKSRRIGPWQDIPETQLQLSAQGIRKRKLLLATHDFRRLEKNRRRPVLEIPDAGGLSLLNF
jgi:hypothetical protein